MRKIILLALGVLILVFAILWARAIANKEKALQPTIEKLEKVVFVDTVQNSTVPIVVPANGTILAKDRLALFSEVEGIFVTSSRDFKPGQAYKQGELLLQINSAEYAASVKSARSNLNNMITAMMPDLRLDYPEAFKNWQNYLNTFNAAKTIAPLPEPTSEQEQYFITGRNITTSYFEIKRMEERLAKYTIKAPFSGILTEALVNKGALVRPGQKLGEYINQAVFEMEVAVSKQFIDFIETGKKVTLQSLDNSMEYQGVISRINAKVDPNTQTVKVFVAVEGKNLREGMFLQAKLEAREEQNAYMLQRKLLVNETQVYVVKNNKLDLQEVVISYITDREVVVKGIPNGTLILKEVLPGAFVGQPVIIK